MLASYASRFNSSREAIRCLLIRISSILQFTTHDNQTFNHKSTVSINIMIVCKVQSHTSKYYTTFFLACILHSQSCKARNTISVCIWQNETYQPIMFQTPSFLKSIENEPNSKTNSSYFIDELFVSGKIATFCLMF